GDISAAHIQNLAHPFSDRFQNYRQFCNHTTQHSKGKRTNTSQRLPVLPPQLGFGPYVPTTSNPVSPLLPFHLSPLRLGDHVAFVISASLSTHARTDRQTEI
ncbi:hypothetical protein Vretimale_14648, partial [Volvox reticuliferus]